MYVPRVGHRVLDRAKSGVRRYRILRTADEPDYVAIELEFDTAAEAERGLRDKTSAAE